jgi:AcrR family transcriptional regulator
MRADARRNRERIVLAARDLFVAQGPDAPLEEIAAGAGVGIATLYRRFPERRSLLRAVALDVLDRATAEARLALAEESDAFAALARFMTRALDLRIGAVMPTLGDRISLEDDEIFQARERSAELMQRLIDRAHAAGSLRPDVTFSDVALLLVRLSRPLPGPIPPELNESLTHRHLTLLLDALRAGHEAVASSLPGPAMTLAELRASGGPSNSDRCDQKLARKADEICQNYFH